VGCARRGETEVVSTSITYSASRISASSVDNADQRWSGWRGGAAEGVAAATNLPVQWSTNSGVRWKAPIPGRGNSSPVVLGDRVFLTSSQKQNGQVRLSVICIDRTSGRQLWMCEPATAHGPTHSKNGFASATPVTDGERLYASFGSAGLFCFDLDGRQLWHVQLNSEAHEWGAATSPVLFGGQVIQVCDQRGESFVAAFDAATGARRWRTARNCDAGWSTPVIIEVNGDGQLRPELVISGSGSQRGGGWVVGYDPHNGAELWRVRGTTEVVCPTPVVAGGLVVACSGRNGPIIAIRPGGMGDVTSSRVAWKHSRGGAYVPTGVAIDGRLYTIRDEGVLTCYDVAGGKRIWEERLRGSFTASLVAGDGKLYATSERGTVYVVANTDKFTLLASNRLDERCLATPAIAGDEFFIRTESQLYCIASQSAPSVAGGDSKAPRTRRFPPPAIDANGANVSFTSPATQSGSSSAGSDHQN
jgi:outer membrane protein assembly factor BamB